MLLNVIQLSLLSFPITVVIYQPLGENSKNKTSLYYDRVTMSIFINRNMYAQEESVWIPLTCLTPQRFHTCIMPGPGFPTSYIMVFFVFSE